jgi:anti-sigma factor RsiW
MTHDELADMLGAYALDAVSPDEASEIATHLADCPRCREELAAHREVAGVLGNLTGTAPAGLWNRIAEELALDPEGRAPSEVPPVAPVMARVIEMDQARARRDARKARSAKGGGWARRRTLFVAAGSVAAALAVVVGVLSARVVNLDHQVTSLSQAVLQGGVQGQVQAAEADPSHRTVYLASTSAPWEAKVVLAGGKAFLVPEKMPAISSAETFQAWAVEGSKYVSLGVIGSASGPVELQLQPQMSSLALNAEPQGGTPQPTTPVLLSARLP